MRLTLSTHSDDCVSYDADGKSESFDAGAQDFSLNLPDGQEIPLSVYWDGSGWSFMMTLPNGTTVDTITPEEEE
jgi:hypothetical protein